MATGRAADDTPRSSSAVVVAYDLFAAKFVKASLQSCYKQLKKRARAERYLASCKTLANTQTRRGRRLGPPNISRRRDMLPHMRRRRQTPSPRPRNAIHRVYIYRAPPKTKPTPPPTARGTSARRRAGSRRPPRRRPSRPCGGARTSDPALPRASALYIF